MRTIFNFALSLYWSLNPEGKTFSETFFLLPALFCLPGVYFPTTVPQAVPIHCLVKEGTWPSACLVQGIHLRNSAESVMQAPIVAILSSRHPVSPAQQASSARKVNGAALEEWGKK